MARRKAEKLDRKGCFAFLGRSLTKFAILMVTLFIIAIFEKTFDYQMLIVQKEVQEGNYEHWHSFLGVMLVVVLLGVVAEILRIFASMWVRQVQKLNFFNRYNGIIQQEGKLGICLLQLEFSSAKVMSIIECFIAIISIGYTLIVMKIVEMTVPQYIGAGMILFLGIACGWYRGTLQQGADATGVDISATEQILSNFFMISPKVLQERLKEVERGYWKQIRIQVIKNFLRLLPKCFKSIIFLAFMWDVCCSGTNTKIYSFSYIVLTAYGYICDVADQIGYVLEDLSKLCKYNRDDRIKALNIEEQEALKITEEQSDNISCDNGRFVISKKFSEPVIARDGSVSYYYLPEDLVIKKGELVCLTGQNGTGKSRLNRQIQEIIPEAMAYDVKTSIVNKYCNNFKCDSEIDTKLIMRLAKGLGAESIPQTESELFEMLINKPLNGAERQLLIAVQILYFAIKRHEQDSNATQLVILDEILANVSEENAPKVLRFIKDELTAIGACTIIVSHAHQKILSKYIDCIWEMKKENGRITISKK